jgi:predicted phage-related endonuclease
MSGSDAWHKIRLFNPDFDVPVRFGASEAAAACGMSPYGGPLDLFMQKRGLKPAFEGNDDTEFGNLIEPVVLEMYSRKTGVTLDTRLPMYFSGTHSFMAATPDGLVRAGDGVPWTIGVDAKSSTHRMVDKTGEDEHKFGEEGTDQVPMYILLQCVQQCEVLNLERVDVPVLIDRRIRIYTVNRDDELAKVIISAEKELAERIIDNRPPEPNWEHPETRSLLVRLNGYSPGKIVDLGLDDHLALTQIDLWKAAAKTLEAKITAANNRLLAKMGDADVGRFPCSPQELKRTTVADSFWTEADVTKASMSIGEIKRAGYTYLKARKAK